MTPPSARHTADEGLVAFMDCDPLLFALRTGHPIDGQVLDLAIVFREARIDQLTQEIEDLKRALRIEEARL